MLTPEIIDSYDEFLLDFKRAFKLANVDFTPQVYNIRGKSLVGFKDEKVFLMFVAYTLGRVGCKA